jgi:hypothetical protein
LTDIDSQFFVDIERESVCLCVSLTTNVLAIDFSMVVVATLSNVLGPNSTVQNGSQYSFLSRNREIGYFFYYDLNRTVVVTVDLTNFSIAQRYIFEMYNTFLVKFVHSYRSGIWIYMFAGIIWDLELWTVSWTLLMFNL